MTAVTLHQYSATTMPAIKSYVINRLVETSDLVKRIPYETQGQLSQTAPVISNIPTPTQRMINEAGQEISVDFAQRNTSLAIYDNTIKIDPVLMRQKNMVQDPREQQVSNASKAMAYQIVDDYVNGDPTASGNRNIPGIFYQLQYDPLFSGQTLNASANSTEVNIAVGTATDAQIQKFLYDLDSLMYLVDTVYKYTATSQMAMLTNGSALIAINSLMRQIKAYNVSRDQYDRMMPTYHDVPFIDAGFKPAGAVNGSIPAAGAAGNMVIGRDSYAPATNNGANAYDKTTPITLIRFGKDYQMGAQMWGFDVKDHGQEKTTPYYWNIQLGPWPVNQAATWQKRALAWLVGYNFSGTTS